MAALVLEVDDHQVGVLIPTRGGYVLFAALPAVAPIDQTRFRTVEAARSAARERLHARAGSPPTVSA
ncbi:hypothetical protein SAMN05216241_10811 [Limimonas halophila]|uniref:Uncharacterized protein n=1 Tax=Limimonas halophila TaxID=1082479 RepID=A0A1G7SZ60_9PROT|nr:hypothetical protein [Limimonas halophila]SDG28261.1 hypothetical protein SAMN05216241_10811 [Limimonas halophila]